MTDFSGRVAVITGAAKGIGRAMAQQFAQRGARVALLDVDTEAAAHAAQTIQQHGGDALSLFADVSDPTTLSHAAAEVHKAQHACFGRPVVRPAWKARDGSRN